MYLKLIIWPAKYILPVPYVFNVVDFFLLFFLKVKNRDTYRDTYRDYIVRLGQIWCPVGTILVSSWDNLGVQLGQSWCLNQIALIPHYFAFVKVGKHKIRLTLQDNSNPFKLSWDRFGGIIIR